MFLNKIRNIFMSRSATNVARAGKQENICVGNNVSATMWPRLPGPLKRRFLLLSLVRTRSVHPVRHGLTATHALGLLGAKLVTSIPHK